MDDGTKKPLVIICHGFMAFKDWGMFPFVGKEFAHHGFVSVVFNFSHNGIADNNKKITDYNAFEHNSISKELADIRSVTDELYDGSLKKNFFDTKTIALVAHSRGGGIAIVHASNDSRVSMLATWSSIARFDRWNTNQKIRWQKDGFLPASNRIQSHPLKLGIDFLNDMEYNAEKFCITTSASRLTIPWLIVQGTEDVITPLNEAHELLEHSNKTQTEFLLLHHVGHLYNAFNEHDRTTVRHVVDVTAHFFQSKL
ncbi:MAG: alpha/beta hydrolase [Ignavibacteria bacterium]|nr:alpha/beta hydrolase [Ignavibacteria bacterium]